MSADLLTAKLGYGPLLGRPFTYGNPAVGTTWLLVPYPTFASGTSPPIAGLHCRITNMHATNLVAWTKTKLPTSTTPTHAFPAFDSSLATVEGGPVPIGASLSSDTFAITDLSTGLWIVASAASTGVIVNFFIET